MKIGSTMIARCLLASLPLFAASAHAQDRDSLVDLINDYRADPGSCDGWRADPVAPLAQHRALGRVYVGRGASLQQALETAGYTGAAAKAISITGPRDAYAAMDAFQRAYCKLLLSTEFTAVGAGRSGDTWQVVFARPAAPAPVARLPDARDTSQILLDAVNRARATDRSCGSRHFAAAPALTLNRALGAAALAHSVDMARQDYFSHQGKDGREVEHRAVQAGYRWRGIGENIALGQGTPEEAMAGWLASPGHCANIMNRGFTEMGAAFAAGGGRDRSRIYWTQVFGQPR
ncbi:MAG: CAP domain-containing protein [Pseudomonadota bacterium]